MKKIETIKIDNYNSSVLFRMRNCDKYWNILDFETQERIMDNLYERQIEEIRGMESEFIWE